MRFISKYAKFGFNVRAEGQRWVKDSSGAERQLGLGDGLYLQFKPGLLTYEEREAAVEIFTRNNPEHPWGAAPKMHDDVISAQEALAEGEAHNAHDGFLPWQRIGLFDTDDPSMCPPAHKLEAEEALLNSMELGIDLFRVDNYNLVAPWPTYPEAATAKVESIIGFAVQGGYDFHQILRYEKATTNRKGLVEALEQKIAEQDQARAEEQALAVK